MKPTASQCRHSEHSHLVQEERGSGGGGGGAAERVTKSERAERSVREALEEVISIMLNLNRSMGIREYLPMQRESADPLEVEKARNSSRDGKRTGWMELKANDRQE